VSVKQRPTTLWLGGRSREDDATSRHHAAITDVHTVTVEHVREWARKAYDEGKAGGYVEAVKSLERTVVQLVAMGIARRG
jgi:hypothetical protein